VRNDEAAPQGRPASFTEKIETLPERSDGAERLASRRWWSGLVLARDVWTCGSLLEGRPVVARNLDGEVLRLSFRGAPLPAPGEFVEVSGEMLDAVAEAEAVIVERANRR
jgi:hypothetical protein